MPYQLPEGVEESRAELINKAMTYLGSVLDDSKASHEEKTNACRVIDSISDTIIKVNITTQSEAVVERTANKLIKQLEKLEDRGL